MPVIRHRLWDAIRQAYCRLGYHITARVYCSVLGTKYIGDDGDDAG